MNVGIDIDDTITAAPWFFSALSKGLSAAGHKVFILTFRSDLIREDTEELLRDAGVEYHELLMGEHYVDLKLKAEWAEKYKLDLVIEDRRLVLDALPEKVMRMWLYPGD